ncbi:DUF424 family protein [archaeon]|jgi:uncharacterized protein|nr:DUF424 family protein [archaeon]
MFVNIIRTYRDVVAICDKELIGKKFYEGKFQLDVKENFYKGEEMNEEKTIQILKNMKREDATFNIVGEKSINAAIKAEVINENAIGKIENIPFSLVLI